MTWFRVRKRPPAQEAGFALIEVMVSALIAVLTTGAVVSLLNSTGRAGAQERHRSQAFSIAQEDQARLRSTRLTELDSAMAPRTVTLNGAPYTVTSSAAFVSDQTGSTACGSEARADYVRIGSKVTWPSMGTAAPVVLESIVSPVSGSLDPSHGSLSVTVVNAAQQKISGVGLSGTGVGTFSGSTDSNGCALFGGEPAGNYTLTPSLGAGYVNPNGDLPPSKAISISPGTTTPLQLEYDQAGSVEVSFKTKFPNNEVKPSTADSIVAFNTGMETAHTFGTIGSPVAKIKATSLFPFTSPDSFYAGSCTTNKPEAGAASVNVPAGGNFPTAVVQLPPLYLTVKNSSGTAISGATVKITDTTCSVSGTPVKRTYTTNSTGNLADPGLPWGTYEICASATVSSKVRHTSTLTGVVVHSLEGTTAGALTVPSSGSEGACP